MTDPFLADAILRMLGQQPIKRSVFVSYHHHGDQEFYDTFSRHFHDTYNCIRDNSLERACDSNDCDYIYQRIRDEYITGTSATIVLLGHSTRWRKFVDWEIKATLDKEHALIGVRLPTAQFDQWGGMHKPDRFQDNLDSGYALWESWENLTPARLSELIETAIARPKNLIQNWRSKKSRNGDAW